MKNRTTAGSVLLESDSDINLRPDSNVSVIKNASIYKMLIQKLARQRNFARREPKESNNFYLGDVDDINPSTFGKPLGADCGN